MLAATMHDEEEDGQEPGTGWFDDADAELDRLMEEDALLDAIQSAPEPEVSEAILTPMQTFEVEQPPTRLTGNKGSSGSSELAGSDVPLGLHSREGAKVKLNPTELIRGEEQVGAAGAAAGAAATKGPRQKSVPWFGVLLAVVTIFTMFYFGADLFEGEYKTKVSVAHAEPRPIMLPATPEEEDEVSEAPATNATGFGVKRGRINVQWSSDSASNATALALGGNDTVPSDEAGKRGDRGRRSRLRSKGGPASDLR